MPSQDLHRHVTEQVSAIMVELGNDAGNKIKTQVVSHIRALANLLDNPGLNIERQVCGACDGTGMIRGPDLLKDLRSRKLPLHRHNKIIPPGQAGDDRRWVCVLCPKGKCNSITGRTNDLRHHLQIVHHYSPENIKHVFDKTKEDQLYRHFGPYTEEEARKNGLKVKEYKQDAVTASKKRGKRTVVPALPDLTMIDFSSLSEKEVTRKATKATSKATMQNDLDGETLLGTTTSSSSKTPRPRGHKRAKFHDNTSSGFVPRKAPANHDMTNSLAGIGDAVPLPETFFGEAFHDGDYLASGSSSGQSSMFLEHKTARKSSLLQEPYNDILEKLHLKEIMDTISS